MYILPVCETQQENMNLAVTFSEEVPGLSLFPVGGVLTHFHSTYSSLNGTVITMVCLVLRGKKVLENFPPKKNFCHMNPHKCEWTREN
ncbi:hypothetical protein AOLI_G00299160 [Acnodon oligacanthus]